MWFCTFVGDSIKKSYLFSSIVGSYHFDFGVSSLHYIFLCIIPCMPSLPESFILHICEGLFPGRLWTAYTTDLVWCGRSGLLCCLVGQLLVWWYTPSLCLSSHEDLCSRNTSFAFYYQIPSLSTLLVVLDRFIKKQYFGVQPNIEHRTGVVDQGNDCIQHFLY